MKADSENTQGESIAFGKIAMEGICESGAQRHRQTHIAPIAHIKLSSFRVYRTRFQPPIIGSIKIKLSNVAEGHARKSVSAGRTRFWRAVLLPHTLLLLTPETSWQSFITTANCNRPFFPSSPGNPA